MMRLKRKVLVKASKIGFVFVFVFLQLGLGVHEFSTVYLLMRRDPVCQRVAVRFHSTNLRVLKHEVAIAMGRARAVLGTVSIRT